MATESNARPSPFVRDALVVVALAAVLVLPPVGHRLIPTSHEARFALIARDMMQRGVWFNAEVRGQPYRNKPPLHPWMIVAGSWVRGRVTDGAARLPSALATVATVLGTFLLADRLFDRRAGLVAGLVVATSYGVFAHSQMILPDVPMIAFGTFAGYWLWQTTRGAGGRMAMVGFYAMLALGLFVKGPAGLLPLAVAIVWLLIERGPPGLRTLWSPWGAALFVALCLVWVVPFATLGKSSRAYGDVVWWDWLYHYFRAPRLGAFAHQLGELAVGFLPWTLLAPLALVHAVRTRSEPPVRFALLWFGVQFILIMASTTQRVRYLLSVYPGLALLVAWWVVAEGRARRVTLVKWTAAGMAVALFVGVFAYDHWLDRTRDFRALAVSVERHARGGEVGVFVSRGEYLQIDHYLGRYATLLTVPAELAAFVARPGHPVVVANQENWERYQRQLPPDLDVLDTIVVAHESLRLVRLRRGT